MVFISKYEAFLYFVSLKPLTPLSVNPAPPAMLFSSPSHCFSPGAAAHALAAGQPGCVLRRRAGDVSACRRAQLVRAAPAGEGCSVGKIMGEPWENHAKSELLLENLGKVWEVFTSLDYTAVGTVFCKTSTMSGIRTNNHQS